MFKVFMWLSNRLNSVHRVLAPVVGRRAARVLVEGGVVFLPVFLFGAGDVFRVPRLYLAAAGLGGLSLTAVSGELFLRAVGQRNREHLTKDVREVGVPAVLRMLLGFFACFVLNFGVLFSCLERLAPGRHLVGLRTGETLVQTIYFSLMTLASSSTSPLSPASSTAMVLVVLESLLGLLLLLIAVALVVGARRMSRVSLR